MIAAMGLDGSLAFYWQPIGSQQWNPEQVAAARPTGYHLLSAPSVAQVGNSTVIAATGPDDSLLFYWQPIGSQQWNPEQVAGPGTTFAVPSVAQVGDSTVIAAQGPDNSLQFYWQPIGSQQWNPEQVAGPGTTFSAPSVAQVGNSTVIAAQGPDGSLQFYWQPIGSQQWNPEQVAGPGTTFSAPSVAQVGNSTVIAAQGHDGSLLFYWQPIGSQQWNPEQVAGPGTTFSAPSVAQVGDSTVIAAAGPRRQPSVLLAAHRLAAVEPRTGRRIRSVTLLGGLITGGRTEPGSSLLLAAARSRPPVTRSASTCSMTRIWRPRTQPCRGRPPSGTG